MKYTMETRKKLAVEAWKSGLNCAQAVLLTYSDLLGIDKEILFKISEGFGSGLSGLKRTCGALMAAVIIAGIVNSDGNYNHPTTKKQTYELGQSIIAQFEEKYKTSQCYDLKGFKDGKVILPCNLCIEEACSIVEEMLLPRLEKK